MLVFNELKENLLKNSSLALGVFDGVHLGHQKVIRNAIEKAHALDSIPTVVTFSKHPRYIISKTPPNMITTLEKRFEIFEAMGVESVIVLDFNNKMAKVTAQDYIENILLGCLNAKNITIGYNHKFGGDKKGNSDFLNKFSNKYKFGVNTISPVKINDFAVSSSAIRNFISNGDIQSTNKFLGREFLFKGTVVHGQHLGRTIGFPTANLNLPEYLIMPKRGVYAGMVKIEGKTHTAVINIGTKPTVSDSLIDLAEVHILDFDKDIYNQEIEVSFQERIRDEQKFASLDELKKQIQADCDFITTTAKIL